MRRFVLSTGFALLLSAMLTGCGGSSKVNNTVTQITATPSTVSVNAGDVTSVTFIAENSVGTPIAANTTFASSNTNIVTVSNAGAICGGQWDASFIFCNGIAAGGAPVIGTAPVTPPAPRPTPPPATVPSPPPTSS